MVARLTPVQKVASSILVRPNLLASDAIFFVFVSLCVSRRPCGCLFHLVYNFFLHV